MSGVLPPGEGRVPGEGAVFAKRSLAGAPGRGRWEKWGRDSCWKELNGKLLGGFGGATDFEKHFIRAHSKHTQK